MIDAKDLVNLSKGEKFTEDDIVESLLQNPDIRDFVERYDLNQAQLEEGILKLMDYKKDTYISDDGVKESRSMPGFKMDLQFVNGRIETPYIRVRKLKTRKIRCFNMPNELTNASFADFSLSSVERRKAYNYAKQFVQTFDSKDRMKGMYLFGRFRSGKTYLASAIANDLADKEKSVIEIYYPELSSRIKDSFNEGSDYTTIDFTEELKSCDLLILDDFGGDSLNTYVRDEILGVVLNYRMVKNKPVIFTSNIPRDKLIDWHLKKDGSLAEATKAMRIMERIKVLTEEFSIIDTYVTKNDQEELF